MNKELYVSSTPHETKVALVEDDTLAEVYYERENEYTLAGSIYKGRVTRVLPGMQSAFVDIGLERDAFLYVSDFLDLEEDEDEDDFSDVKVTGQTLAQANGFVASQPKPEAPAQQPSESTSAESKEPVAEPAAETGTRRLRGRRRRGRRGGRDRALRIDENGNTPAETAPVESTELIEEEEELPPFDVEDLVSAVEAEDSFDSFEFTPDTLEASAETTVEEDELEEVEKKEVKSKVVAEKRPAATYTPIILPGESISKYRDGSTPIPVSEEDSSEEYSEPRRDSRGRGRDRDSRGRGRDRFDRGERGERRERGPREPEAPLPANYTPIVLPGESISKYRSVAPIELPESFEAEPETIEENLPAIEAEAPAEESAAVEEAKESIATKPAAKTTKETESEEGEPRSHASVDAPEDPAFRFPWSHGSKEKGEETVEAPVTEPEVSTDEKESSAPARGSKRRGSRRGRGNSPRGNQPARVEQSGNAAAPAQNHNHNGDEEDDNGQFGENVRDQEQQRTLDEYEYEEGEEFEESELSSSRAAATGDTTARRGRGRERTERGRGPNARHGRPHREPRIIPQISDVLKEGQEILVQIAKEPIGKKGARITSHIALPGRFLVYMPTVNHIGVSRKISSDDERQRLKRIVASERENGHGGFIVRTAAANIDEEELRADIRFLKHLWQEIRTRGESSKSPSLIYHDLNLVERVLRDQVTSDFSQIWVDTQEEYERVVRFASRFQPALVKRIKLYTKQTPLFEEFGLTEEINKALKSKVWLKSGGYLVINQTEALVAIDINTGKYVGKTSRLEDTIVKTNIEACKEIVRQVRLRDLGGIIVIDFIDMDERKNRAKVMSALEEAMKADRAPSKILQFNDFGLVAVTRKRVKQSLERTLGTSCPYCQSTGVIKSTVTVCNDIYVEFRKIRSHIQSKDVTLRVNPEVAKELKTQNGRRISELEELTGHPVIVKSDQLVHMEQFDINF